MGGECQEGVKSSITPISQEHQWVRRHKRKEAGGLLGKGSVGTPRPPPQPIQPKASQQPHGNKRIRPDPPSSPVSNSLLASWVRGWRGVGQQRHSTNRQMVRKFWLLVRRLGSAPGFATGVLHSFEGSPSSGFTSSCAKWGTGRN